MAIPARMSGDSTVAPRSSDGPATSARCGSQRTMRAPMPTSLSTKNIRDSNIFSCIRIEPAALRRGHDRDRHEIRRERGPRLILELGDVAARGRAGSRGSARPVRAGPAPSVSQTTPSRSKPMPHRPQVLDAGVGDAQRGARHRRQPDERADLDVVRPDPMATRRPAVRPPSTVIVLVPIPSICGAQRDEELRQILHVRLAGRVAEHRRAAGRGRDHQRVLRRRDARLVEKDIGALAGACARR